MKYRIAVLTIILLFLGSGPAAAEKVRIKYVTAAYNGANGASLQRPEGVACDGDAFWVADTGNNRLLRFALKDQTLSAEAEIEVTNASPTVIQVNSKGEIYVLNTKERRIVLLNAQGEPKGFVTPKNMPGDKQVTPKSFKIDGEDNIYILDLFSSRVLVLDPKGQYRREIAFPEEHGFFSDLAVDSRGTIFLLDSVKSEIQTANADAESFTLLTKNLEEFVNFPTSLAVDSRNGNIYVVDQYGSGLALVGRDGSFLGRKLGLGWKESLLYYPAQICLAQDGHIFIADRNNNRAQLFTAAED